MAKQLLYTLLQVTSSQLEKNPDSVSIVLGDMNKCDLDSVLIGYKQYVTCNTRKDAVLDNFYCNINTSNYKCPV